MLDLKMKDMCRICRRELCGNQRRWIFHTTAKQNLQVILSHILGKELLRDGHAEFVCSKCAFMLERFYRFDTVIARIEALSIERLQKLLSEKNRLKHCLASLYRKNNNEEGQEAKSGEGTVETANTVEVQYSYSALLQEDFIYSGYESWTELEEPSQEIQYCSHNEGTGTLPRKCHGCSSLRVADADYEAVCKVPRRVAQNISSGQMFTCTSTSNELVTIPQTSENEAANDNVLSDGDGLERLSSHSVESLPDTKDPGSNIQKAEEKVKSATENPKCHCSSCNFCVGSCGCVRKLDLALTLVKMFDYKPVQSPRGSKIPVKSCSVIKLNSTLSSAQSRTSNTGLGFLDSIMESPPKTSQDTIAENCNLHELWHNVYEDYIPIFIQNLAEKKGHDATQYETLLSQQAQNLHKSGMEVQALQEKLQESKDIIKTLQESQHQLTSNLNNAEELTHNQECLLQSLRDSLQSKDNEVMELYQIIDEHNATIANLQDMLLKSQNEQLQTFQVMPTQLQSLELQNTLFCTQIELQKKQMALRQKEQQLTDVKRSQKLLEVDLLEGQQQKETTWKHNQELHGALHKLQKELQEKIQHLKNLEEEKCTKLLAQEYSIERLKQAVSQKEQILQEYIDVLHYQPNLERVHGGSEHMIQKLQQRIKERDAALEKAVDDKFCALEEKEKEIQQLKMIIREREHDLERLSNVLSGNEETINSLDSLVKAKDMELDQISAAYKNLQWLKQETEEKYRCSLNERESIIQQLQKNLQERNKEMEEIRTNFLGKFDICSGHMIEELKMCLQRKENMLQDAVFARNQQAEEHMKEVMDLLAMVSSEKLDQTSSCQNCLLKENNTGVNQYVENLSNFIHLQKLVQEKEKIIQTLTQSSSVQPMVISMKSEDSDVKGEVTENNKALKSDLAKAKEDLRLVLRKMREYQLEVSVLQSIIMKQNEQLREQATDIDTLTRKNQMKDQLIKDLQVKLADPEEIPTVEFLTQQIFTLKENIATLNLASHGHLTHTQKIFKFLEELAANKSRLNEALQAEKQLYSCLVQFHTETDSFSSSSSSALHNELLAVQTLRAQLEGTLMRTMEQLVTLQSESKVQACFGDGLVKYDTKNIHMDFQDLGYETCGKSENEIDREETTSAECEEDGEINHMVQKDCDDQYSSPMTSMIPAKNKGFLHTDQKSEVKKLKSHLQTFKKLLQQLQSQSCLSSKCRGFTEEDEGWQSDTTGRNSYTVLEQLAKRVSKLESYIYYFRKDAGIQCSLKSVTIPGNYDWLIQAQARELSLLRQKVAEGQSMCNILTQHLDEGLKSFEEMLQVNDIDYFMGQSFRQHLFQVNQLAKKLKSKLNNKGFSLNLTENMKDELLANRPNMKIMQKDDLMETFQSTCENRSSHDYLESDGSSMSEDQLSASDELDGVSELSATSSCFCYEPNSTQDSDFCNSVFLKTASDGRNGLYIFCHSEDFGTLKKNLLFGKTLLYNIETHIYSLLHIPYVEVHGGKVKDCGNISSLFSAIRTMDNILEESNSILSLFWNANQPTKEVNKQQKREDQVARDEICTLKNKLKEQEVLLQKALDKVKNANFAREGMEKLIKKQLTTTCGALTKARLNLLVKSNNIVQPSVQLT